MIAEADKQLIGPIAAFIGARLQHVLPPYNSRFVGPVSTISIDQYKDKFAAVRIYCTLADPDLVQAKALGIVAIADDAFKAACLKHDAIFYRRCHLDMVKLVPHLRDAICSQADYYELLFENVAALNAWLDQLAVPDPQVTNKFEHFFRRYHVDSVDKLRQLLASFYIPR
jgi:hypothetical protein